MDFGGSSPDPQIQNHLSIESRKSEGHQFLPPNSKVLLVVSAVFFGLVVYCCCCLMNLLVTDPFFAFILVLHHVNHLRLLRLRKITMR